MEVVGHTEAENPILMLQREKVFRALLHSEVHYLPHPHYFTCVQRELMPYTRRVLTSWMFEICEEQRCEEDVFLLAVNIVDRFLSLEPLRKNRLQLLGATALFIASKMKQMLPLSAKTLCLYTDHSVHVHQLLQMELLVLNRLKWDVAAVTPHDFIDYFLYEFPVQQETKHILRKHTHTFVALCATDVKFMAHLPSIIAASSIAAAAQGLNSTGTTKNFTENLATLIHTDPECLQTCQDQIELLLEASLGHQVLHPSVTQHKHRDENEATVPTDVRDANS